MKTASITALKREMAGLPQEELLSLLIKLSRYKKDNKELLSYLLFEAGDEAGYQHSVKDQIAYEFEQVNKNSLYFAKKTIRKILKLVKKYIKYSGKKETEVELLIFFCLQLKKTRLPLTESKVLMNLYQNQVEAIHKALASLHEDLQYDYERQVASLDLN